MQSLESYPQGESNIRNNIGKNARPAVATRTATYIGDKRLETIIAVWDRLP
jgi:hypothetical protein